MFSKHLTNRLREEHEKELQRTGNENPSMNAQQCDRLIRTVSCKVRYIFFLENLSILNILMF
jgi:hypothetical protein